MFTTKYMKNQPKPAKQRVKRYEDGGPVASSTADGESDDTVEIAENLPKGIRSEWTEREKAERNARSKVADYEAAKKRNPPNTLPYTNGSAIAVDAIDKLDRVSKSSGYARAPSRPYQQRDKK